MAGFDLSAMRHAIAQCDVNIKVFEAAIQKEENTKAEYRQIIKHLEDEAAGKNKPRVEVVVEKD